VLPGGQDPLLPSFHLQEPLPPLLLTKEDQDSSTGELINFWINEHDVGHPAGCNPILILDVFEHAFMIDYGLKRADYIEAFFKNIEWKAVDGRIK